MVWGNRSARFLRFAAKKIVVDYTKPIERLIFEGRYHYKDAFGFADYHRLLCNYGECMPGQNKCDNSKEKKCIDTELWFSVLGNHGYNYIFDGAHLFRRDEFMTKRKLRPLDKQELYTLIANYEPDIESIDGHIAIYSDGVCGLNIAGYRDRDSAWVPLGFVFDAREKVWIQFLHMEDVGLGLFAMTSSD